MQRTLFAFCRPNRAMSPIMSKITWVRNLMCKLIIRIEVFSQNKLTIIREKSSSLAPASVMYRSRLLITYGIRMVNCEII